MKTTKYLILCFLVSIITDLTGQNVGIGTVNPTEKLHIEGNVRITDLSDNNNKTRLVLADDTGVLLTIPNGINDAVLTSTITGISWEQATNTAWGLRGNAGTGPTNFIGTTDNQYFQIRANNIPSIYVNSIGSTGIGSLPTNSKLTVSATDPTTGFQFGEYINMTERLSGGPWTGELKFIQTSVNDNHSSRGDFNWISGDSDENTIGYDNLFSISGQGNKVGLNNSFEDSEGLKTGVETYFRPGPSTGIIYGVRNRINNTSNSIKSGVHNIISGGTGTIYGTYNRIIPGATNASFVYGLYSTMDNIGTGTKIGGFFNAAGTNNFAAIFNAGRVVVNDIGGNYDFRVETEDLSHAIWVDADRNATVFGSNSAVMLGNGTAVAGTTVQYVADFDLGTGVQHGTAIGIGSQEYLLDGIFQTHINTGFAPTTHMFHDLGYSTSDRAWDDVYADDFVNVSDLREKHDVVNLTYGLEEVLKMRPVAYKLNRDPFGETKLGLIAQEVLPLVKEVVKTHDHKILDESTSSFEEVELERMGMSYQELIPVLIKATQEQNDLIKNQQLLIEELQKEVELLKEQ